MVTLSLVIPATDRRPTLTRALAAVDRAQARPEEMIVVDRPSALGPAAARNLGARRATGDVLVFVDADIEVHEDAFARIRDVFESDAELSAVFGSYDDDPAAGGIVSDFRNLLHHHVHHEGAGPATTFWSGLGAVRRDVFLRLGGFDESLAWIEDIELGMRMSAEGGKIVLDPAIRGKHLKHWTLFSMIRTDLLGRGVPWLRLLLEDRSHSTTLNLGWRHRVGTAASVALVAALARRNTRLAASLLALLVVLDLRFHGLLFRRRGARMVVAGVPLHVVHRLTAATAVPVALTAHVLGKAGASRRGRQERRPRR
jgi:GT2 family glycosyltransferase